MAINKKAFEDACKCLIDNGIEADEAETVCQAIAYILTGEETESLMDSPMKYAQYLFLDAKQSIFAHNKMHDAKNLGSVRFTDGHTISISYLCDTSEFGRTIVGTLCKDGEAIQQLIRKQPDGTWDFSENDGTLYSVIVECRVDMLAPLKEDDIELTDPELNDETVCWYIPINFDPDKVFGLGLNESDDYINLYLNYNVKRKEIVELFLYYASNTKYGDDWDSVIGLDYDMKRLLHKKASEALPGLIAAEPEWALENATNADFVSVWDGGTKVTSRCVVLKNGQVCVVGENDYAGDDGELEVLERQFIVRDEDHAICPVEQKDEREFASYWYE